MNTGFFQSISGNKSSSRLIGFIVVVIALVFAQEIIYAGLHTNPIELMGVAGAAGTLFITIAGPAMGFLFLQKKTEVKQENNSEPTQIPPQP